MLRPVRQARQQFSQVLAGDDVFGMCCEFNQRAVEIEKERVAARIERGRRGKCVRQIVQHEGS
jgi:hypothetical protein